MFDATAECGANNRLSSKAIIGGLTSSGVLTIFIVPAAYLLVYGKRNRQTAMALPTQEASR
jgi:multidrug efflux pump subunit AcrB